MEAERSLRFVMRDDVRLHCMIIDTELPESWNAHAVSVMIPGTCYVRHFAGRKGFRNGAVVSNMTAANFSDGAIEGLVVKHLKTWSDHRGWLIELFRHDEMEETYWPVMAYVSSTLPGVSRGPHEHVEQSDCFAFIGPGDLCVYCWDNRPQSPTYRNRMKFVAGASMPTLVIIPPGIAHAYKCVSDVPGVVFNAANKLYAGWGKKETVDEIRHERDNPEMFPLD
jgi:dTDP-4-dehydrorhamnose 3,5-epimerase